MFKSLHDNDAAQDAALSPAERGYWWPAEWAPHAATWLAWPHNAETWPGKFEKVPTAFAQFVQVVAEFEPVNIVASGEALREAERTVGRLAGVSFFDIPTNDAWIRDFGPTFLCGRASAAPAAVNWIYNGWGEKYPPFDLDQAAGRRIVGAARRRCFTPNLVVEGGAIEGNGAGLLLTTRSCLLAASRNPGLTVEDVEQALRRHLAVEKILWLEGGPFAGDDTDGHIDQLARFVDERTIVTVVEKDSGDPNYLPLQRNFHDLQAMTDARGRPLEVVALPLPMPRSWQGQRLPASYCNFYIINDAVIVPTFDDRADEQALGVLAGLFSGRRVLGLPALDLVLGLGAFHCLSQQEPIHAATPG